MPLPGSGKLRFHPHESAAAWGCAVTPSADGEYVAESVVTVSVKPDSPLLEGCEFKAP